MIRIGKDLPHFDLSSVRAQEFDEFAGNAEAFLDQVDPQEIIEAITPEDIAAADYHPNGFFVLRLTDPSEKSENGQLRIHLWHPDIAKTEDADTHQHPWHLASKILHGEYLEHRAQVIETPEDESNFHSVRFEYDPATSREHLVDPIPMHVSLSDLDVYQTGQSHYLDESEYHYTPTANNLLVTMPIMGRELTVNRRILVPNGQALKIVEYPYPRASEMDARTMWRHVQLAQRALRQTQ